MQQQESYLTSNFQFIDKYIESNIEKKLNQLFDVLPQSDNVQIPKMIHEYTVYEIYQGTLETAINVINDITALNAEIQYMDSQIYRQKLIDIFLLPERRIYVGIILVILSFILYFIDGASV
jgi:hypothetical protein